MTKREEIRLQIEAKKTQILRLKEEIKTLTIDDYKLSDDKQWYTEEVRTDTIKRRPKVTEENLYGIIHWNEGLKDEDTNEIFTIERYQKVMKNGIFYV